MNKSYKVIKSKSTGCMSVVSELVKGAKKGGAAGVVAVVLSLSAQADTGVPQGYTPANNDDAVGHTTISSSDTLDLSAGDGFSSTEKGEEVKQHTFAPSSSIVDLYRLKYGNVADAQTAYDNAVVAGASESELEGLQTALTQAQTIAAGISDEQFVVTGDVALLGSDTQGANIVKGYVGYTDPVTGATLQINAIQTITEVNTATGVGGTDLKFTFYEKTPQDDQYSGMNMIEVTGAGTVVNVENTGSADNAVLNAISKNETGVINVTDGGSLNYNTDTAYYTGGGASTSQTFSNGPYTSTNTTNLKQMVYPGGFYSSALGMNVTIDNASDYAAYNQLLLNKIKTDIQLRLDYATTDAMQAWYDAAIAEAGVTTSYLGSYTITYSMTYAEVEALADESGLATEFANKVTSADTDDIGLQSTSNNYFIGVKNSGSTVNLSEGNTIKNYTDEGQSGGSIIRGDWDESGETAQNTYNINGTLDANGYSAIKVNNAEVNVSSTGTIKGDVSIKGSGAAGGTVENTLNNDGAITGNVVLNNGTINNNDGASIGSIGKSNDLATNVTVNNAATATIAGSVLLGNNSTVDNSGSIGGSVSAGENATISNNTGATIGGWVTAGNGSTVVNDSIIGGGVIIKGDSEFTNNGTVTGSQNAYDGATTVNNGTIISQGKNNVVSMDSASSSVNGGDIYIGYNRDEDGNPEVAEAAGHYVAIRVDGAGSKFTNANDGTNAGNIYVSSTQTNATIVQVQNGSSYVSDEGTNITLNADGGSTDTLGSTTGNSNKAILVKGADSTADIAGTITLNDSGSTAIQAQDGATVDFSGEINLNSQNVDSTAVANFGIWAQGDGTTVTLSDDAIINMNADRAIGVHVRDGATVVVNDEAGIVFADDKTNQIGFLISGISDGTTALEYNSTKDLVLAGEGSVLFRVERGSNFSSSSIDSDNPTLSTFSTNGTKDATIFVITSGQVATGSNHQTTADLSGFTLEVDGEDAIGVRVEGGAQATITDSTTLSLTGDGAILAKVDGKYYDLNGNVDSSQNGASTLTSSADLQAGGNVDAQDAIGYYVTNGGKLIHQGTINFDEPSRDNIGVKIDNGGTLVSEEGSNITVHGTAVEISGSNSLATINNDGDGSTPVVTAVGAVGNTNDSAYHVKDQASLKLTGDGITQAIGTAHGILVDGASSITLDGATLDLYGDGTDSSSGNGIENRSSLTNITLANDSVINVKDGYGIHSAVGVSSTNASTSATINVYGSGTGIRFEGIDSTDGHYTGSTTNAISNTGYENVVVNVFESNGYGIWVDSTKDVATSASVNIISDVGNSALVIAGSSENVTQSGKLHSASTGSTIVDLNNGYVETFTNKGDLLYGSFDSDLTFTEDPNATDYFAVSTTGDKSPIIFTNDGTGNINGKVSLLGHTGDTGNTVNLKAGSKAEYFVTGDGEDVFNVSTMTGADDDGVRKQFSKIEGGAGYDKLNFGTSTDFTINNTGTIKDVEYVGLDSSKLTVNTTATLNGVEDFDLNNASQLTINELDAASSLVPDAKSYNITDVGSTVNYNKNGNLDLSSQLLGKGTFVFDGDSDDTAQSTLEFVGTANTGGTFEGTVELRDAYLDLDKDATKNTDALTNATLKASKNSTVDVGKGTQNIGALDFNAGTVNFGTITMNDGLNDNNVAVTDLNLGSGNVQITVGGDDDTGLPSSKPLLEQDDANMTTQLVASVNEVTGDVNNLKLIDEDGEDVPDPVGIMISQDGEDVARASYGTDLTTGADNKGLYVVMGLTQVELKVANNHDIDTGNALKLDATGKTDKAAELTAKLTDFENEDGTYTQGDLQIVGSGTVTLTNASNDYHGVTYVKDTSTLKSGSDNALGNTKELNLDANTAFDLNGNNQTIGALQSVADSTVNVNGGHLTISGVSDSVENSVSNGALKGSGTVTIQDNSLTINGSNTDLSAKVVIGDNDDIAVASNIASVNVKASDSLGTGEVVINSDGVLNVALNGIDGELTNSVISSDASATTGELNKTGDGTLTMKSEQAQYYGVTNLKNGTLVLDGTSGETVKSSTVNVASGTSLSGINNVVLEGEVVNSGTFYVGNLVGGADVNSATVTVGSYTGTAGSLLSFNGALASDDSPINQLIVTGDTEGESLVKVNNIGGLGAETIEGIKIIDVGGDSNATFTKASRILAGAYDYSLVKKDSDWYLESGATMRPEAGSYLANLVAANTLFDMRLHDRVGESQFLDSAVVKEGEDEPSVWARVTYNRTEFDDTSRQLSNKTKRTMVQAGGDVARWSDSRNNRFVFGLMAGYGKADSDSRAALTGYASSSEIEGFSVGAYGTWYANKEDKTGFHLDGWLLWSKFSASVSGTEVPDEKYGISGLTASLEAGYTFKVKQGQNYSYFLQPKAQVTMMNVDAEDHVESNGTYVKGDSKNIQTRLGMKAYASNDAVNPNSSWQPFVEVNWLHNTKPYEVYMNETNIKQGGTKDIGEIKLGVERKATKATSFWLNAAYQFGSKGYQDYGAKAGIKYSF